MSEEASITPLVSHLRQLSCLYQRLSSESKNLVEECKQTGNQLSMLQQLLEGLPNSPTASTTVTSLCSWAADKLQVQIVLLWILDKGTKRLWTLLPGGEVIYAPFVEEDGSTAALRPPFEKDVATVHANEAGWHLEQCLLPSDNTGGRLPHRFSMIGLVRNETGEGTAVLQAVNSLRNEENNFIQEDEIHMKGILSTVAAVTGLVKAMFEQESALAEAFGGRSTQSGRDGNNNDDSSSSEEMKNHDEFVPRDWLIEKFLQNTARAVGAVSCKLVLHDRIRNNDVGSISPSLHPISQALEERMLILSSPVLAPGTGVFLGKILTTFVAENESKATEALPSSSQEAYLAEVSVVVGTVLTSAFNRFSHADRAARAVLACQGGDHIGMCETVAREIKLVVACAMVKAACFGLEDQGQEEQFPQSPKSMTSPPSSDEGEKSKWVGFSVSGSCDTGVSISGTSLDMGDLIQEGNIGVKDMELLLHSASQSSDIAHESASLMTENGSGGVGVIATTCGVFLERCVVVPLAFGCDIVAIVERDQEDDPFSPLEMSAILHLGYELGLLVSMRMRKVDKAEEEEGQQQDIMVSRRKGMEKDDDELFQISRIEMKEEATTAAWTTVRQFAQSIPLPVALHSDCGGGQFLYSIRSSILPEVLVSVICNIVPGCVYAAVYDHVSIDDQRKGVVESDDYDIQQQQETTDAEKMIRCCRVIALRCVSNGKSEWVSTEILQQSLPDFQSDMVFHQGPPTRCFDSSNSKNTGSIECNPPPLETNAAAAVSDVSMFYVPLPGRDAALELTCAGKSKAAEHIALGIAPIFSSFLPWRDKVAENLISSAMRAFSIAVKRIAFRHLAIHAQREVKLKFELRMEDMKAEFSREREELLLCRSLFEMEKEHSEEESCKQQRYSQLEEEGGARSATIKSNDEKNHQDIRENTLVNIKVAHIDNDEGDATQQCKSIVSEEQQDMIAALENQLLNANLSFSNEREKLHMELDELRNINKIKEALELQVETLKSEMTVVREEQHNCNYQWELEVEELQSKLLTANEWHQNSLNENQELQKHVELMSISLRDANMENVYLHEHFKDLESELHAAQKEKDDGFKSLTENVQLLRQDLCDCALKLQNVEDENQKLQFELSSADEGNRDLLKQLDELKMQRQNEKNEKQQLQSKLSSADEGNRDLLEQLDELHFQRQNVEDEKQQLQSELSSADEGNRDLLKQLDELKLQWQNEKNEENELRSKLMAIEKENNHFLRNLKDFELKLSSALVERDAIQAEKDTGELMVKQELENMKLNARREIDTLQLKLEEECMKLRSMTDDHVAKEGLFQSEIETIKRNLHVEETKNYSELKMAIQRHLGNDLAISNEINTFEDLLSMFQTHLEVKHSFEMQEKDKAFQLQLDSAVSHLMGEKSGLQSQLDNMKIKFSALQDNVLILSKEKESTKSELDSIQDVLYKERFEHETQLQKEIERCQALEMHQSLLMRSDLVAYNKSEELCGGTQAHQSQQQHDDLSSNRSLHVEVGEATANAGEYDVLHPAELVSLLKIRDKEMSTLVKCLHDAVQDKDNLEAQLQHEMGLMKSRFCDEVATLESRLTEENDNRIKLSRRNAFSTWHLTAMQLKEKKTIMERNPTPDDDGGYNNHLSLMAPPPASPRSVSLCHETSSHCSLVSLSSSSSMHTLLQCLVETLSAPPDFTLPSDLPSFAKCVQNVAIGLFGVDAAHLYVVHAARGDLQLCLPNDRVGNEEGSEDDVIKQKQHQTFLSGVPHSASFGKGLVGAVAITAQPQVSVDIDPENPDYSINILCMPVMLRAHSNTTAMWHESKRLEIEDDDLESENVEVLGVLHLSRVSLHNQEGGDLEEDLGIGFTGDDARVVATFCGQVALALSSLQRRIVLCHRLEEVVREKTRVVQRINGEDVMTRELKNLRARLNVAEARLIARNKRGTGKKQGRWGHTVERGMFYSKHITALIEKQRDMQSTVMLLNSENARLRRDLEKERDEREREKEKEQRLLPVLVRLRQLHDIDTKCVEKHKRQKKRNVR